MTPSGLRCSILFVQVSVPSFAHSMFSCRLLIHVKDVCIVIENVISSVIFFAYVIIITMMVTTMMMRGCSEEKGACTAYAWEATAYNLLQQLSALVVGKE
uniref:Uncharacterized protein n=1 Tax=Lotharella globosa TaxID=91324 RepID=A0A7S3YWN4_9EUKA